MEIVFSRQERWWGRDPGRHALLALLAKGYQVHYQQFVGGHDGLSWRGGLADGLINLLGGR